MSDLARLELAFYSGEYAHVLAASESQFDETEASRLRLLKQRALIEEGRGHEVVESLQGATNPSSRIVRAYALHRLGDVTAIDEVDRVIAECAGNDVVKHLGALCLVREGREDDALSLLASHRNSLDCVLLTVYIYLKQNRVDEAASLISAARSWADDHLVFCLGEAWVALGEGAAGAQNASYVFEENNNSAPTALGYLGEAIAQLQLKRVPEAAQALKKAQKLGSPEDVMLFAAALAIVRSAESDERQAIAAKLGEFKDSAIAEDFAAKSALFDKIVIKYAI